MTKLIIQIPCLNEEETLPETLRDLPRSIDGVDEIEFLVIDDGSTDRTVEVARELGVHHIVSHGHNRGLARAFMTGVDAALAAGADIIVNTDADNQYSGGDIPALVASVLDGADLAIGTRPIGEISTFSRTKKYLQGLGSGVVRWLSGLDIRDATSGFRAFSRDTALRFGVFNRYTYTLETIMLAGAEGLDVRSVPISVNPQTRPSRLVKSSSAYVRRSIPTIIRSFALYRPFRFFCTIGFFPFLVGVALVIRWALIRWLGDDEPSRVPSLVAAAVFLVAAFQLWSLAFAADLISATRRLQAEQRYHERARRFSGRSEP